MKKPFKSLTIALGAVLGVVGQVKASDVSTDSINSFVVEKVRYLSQDLNAALHLAKLSPRELAEALGESISRRDFLAIQEVFRSILPEAEISIVSPEEMNLAAQETYTP